MRRCLKIAEEGRRNVGNGALVGAVLVRDEKIIAEGIHLEYGKYHAERDLVQKFDQQIRSTDVLYVSLEPCCHHGKTPPCADILLERGIKNVVYGMQDPDIRMAGKGIVMLRDAGVNVVGPVLRAECEYFNRGFVSVRTKNRPFITLKQALARDGSFANPNGSPKKITNQTQDIWTHTNLRFPADGIVVGVGTILSDNPYLNTRLRLRAPDGQARFTQKNALIKEVPEPYRIILDAELRTPITARVVTDAQSSRTMIVVRDDLAVDATEFTERGVIIIRCPYDGSSFDLDALFQELITLKGDYHGLTSLLIEGGAKTLKTFREAGAVDEEVTLIGNT